MCRFWVVAKGRPWDRAWLSSTFRPSKPSRSTSASPCSSGLSSLTSSIIRHSMRLISAATAWSQLPTQATSPAPTSAKLDQLASRPTIQDKFSSRSNSTTNLGLYPLYDRRVPHTPDFLCSFAGSLDFMRLSLKRAAHADAGVSRVAYRKFGASRWFMQDVGYRRSPPQAPCGPHSSAISRPLTSVPVHNDPTLSHLDRSLPGFPTSRC